MVKLHSSEMFIKDPVDAWGKEHSIGLSELAVRNAAPPMTYDRRGSLLLWDNYENNTQVYKDLSGGTGAIRRSIDICKTGAFSLRCDTGATANDWAGVEYKTSDFHVDKMGVQGMFSTAITTNLYVYQFLRHYDGPNSTLYGIRWASDGSAGVLKSSYVNPGDPYEWIQFTTSAKYYPDIQNFGTFKLVCDIENGKHERALLFGTEYDLTAYDGRTGTTGRTEEWIKFEMYFSLQGAGVASTGYIDSIIITDAE